MQVNMRTAVVLLLAFSVLSICILPTTAYFIDSEWATEIDDASLGIDIDTSAEIVVFVVPSLTGHGLKNDDGQEINDIVQLGVYIFNDLELETYDGSQIGIGKPGKDNGLLILVAVEEQQWRIEVGYGLEGDITDVESNRIAQNYLVPQLKQSNYGEALYDTVVALGKEIPETNETDFSVRGYYVYETEQAYVPEPWWATTYYGMPVWLIILLALCGIFVPVLGKSRGRGGRSGGGGSTGKW
jgi:hypothetical protein